MYFLHPLGHRSPANSLLAVQGDTLSSPLIIQDLLPPCTAITTARDRSYRLVPSPLLNSLPPVSPSDHSAMFKPEWSASGSDEASESSGRSTPVSQNTWRHQARGRDGRFLPKGTVPRDIDKQELPRICGWCNTTKTTQWRVGPTTGSARKWASHLQYDCDSLLTLMCLNWLSQKWACCAMHVELTTDAQWQKQTTTLILTS